MLILPLTIPSSPNHRMKPPSKHLNLDLRIPPEANGRLDSQTKSSASIPKDSATQMTDQIVPNPNQEISKPIMKLVVAATAPATLLQTCAPDCNCNAHQLGNRNSEMLSNENWRPVFIVILPVLLGPTSPSGYVSVQYIIINSG